MRNNDRAALSRPLSWHPWRRSVGPGADARVDIDPAGPFPCDGAERVVRIGAAGGAAAPIGVSAARALGEHIGEVPRTFVGAAGGANREAAVRVKLDVAAAIEVAGAIDLDQAAARLRQGRSCGKQDKGKSGGGGE